MAGLIEPKICMLTQLDPGSNMGGVATPSDTPTSKLEHFLFWLGLRACLKGPQGRQKTIHYLLNVSKKYFSFALQRGHFSAST